MKYFDMLNKRADKKPPYKDADGICYKLKEYAGKRSICCIKGREWLEICGCCGLITYKDHTIEINLCDGFIKICGKNLNIRNYYGGRMLISGQISSLNFCNPGKEEL